MQFIKFAILSIALLVTAVHGCLEASFVWSPSNDNFLDGSLVDNGDKICWINRKRDAFDGNNWANLDCIPGFSAAMHKEPLVMSFTPAGRETMLFELNNGSKLGNKYVRYVTARVYGC